MQEEINQHIKELLTELEGLTRNFILNDYRWEQVKDARRTQEILKELEDSGYDLYDCELEFGIKKCQPGILANPINLLIH